MLLPVFLQSRRLPTGSSRHPLLCRALGPKRPWVGDHPSHAPAASCAHLHLLCYTGLPPLHPVQAGSVAHGSLSLQHSTQDLAPGRSALRSLREKGEKVARLKKWSLPCLRSFMLRGQLTRAGELSPCSLFCTTRTLGWGGWGEGRRGYLVVPSLAPRENRKHFLVFILQ